MKVIMLVLLCTAGILLAGCSNNNSSATRSSSADYPATYNTEQPHDPTSKLTILDELESLGLHVEGLILSEDGDIALSSTTPRISIIPTVPFGIDNEDTLEVLLDVIDILISLDTPLIDMGIGIYSRLETNGLLEVFLAQRRERRLALMTSEDYAIHQRTSDFIERHARTFDEEMAIWPGLIEDAYVDILAELGFKLTISSILEPIIVSQIDAVPQRISTEEDIEMLLLALFHLSDIRYAEDLIDISEVMYALDEAGLWPQFVTKAQSRIKNKIERHAPLLYELEALGVLFVPTFYTPGETPQDVWFDWIQIPHQVRVTINPDVEFVLASDVHLTMLSQAIELFDSTIHWDISDLMQELMARDLWEQYLAISRDMRMDFLEQMLFAREERIAADF